ncbi:type II toxin-antitoxin system RelE/ParE family toxin [Dyadobacter crusticola]|uniref:type II toxin-antitoxin system RelE/ParE family toxin n=1 Tax=Dyadobacter crusticola TaxID=292407 RepID=UPI0004E1BA0B|nr:type II toxin-antitoxin system RelE/ParE family toxin [Dyadobacter crusticola]
MALKIIWSARALDNFQNVIAYLEEDRGEQVIRTFVKRTEKIINIAAQHPEIFRIVSEKRQIREAVITKHNLLIYKATDTHIQLLAIFDTRQHPRRSGFISLHFSFAKYDLLF